jgi:hypothetical protein
MSASMDKQPTVKQMKNRMHAGHRECLTAIRDGKQIGHPGITAGEIRGYRVILDTLRRWGAVNDAGLTDIGRQLLSYTSH